jgi:hypothetical protein
VRWTPSVSFSDPQGLLVGATKYSAAVADFTADGRPDLVTADYNDGTVSVLVNTTPAGAAIASFATRQTFAVGRGPRFITVTDFNGDGRPDLAVTNYTDGTVSVLLNTTPAGATMPSFAAQQTFALPNSPDTVVAADFNGDGRPDLAVANVNDIAVFMNTTPRGATTVSFAPRQDVALSDTAISLAVADFNGDGRPDLAFTLGIATSSRVGVLLNSTAIGAGSASFAALQTYSCGNHPIAVAAADLNGDGRPDLVVANQDDNTVSVLLNTTSPGAGSASFTSQQTYAVGSGPRSVVVGDFDGDGRPDLGIANLVSQTVSVLLNTTPAGATAPSFTPQQTFTSTGGSLRLAVGDFNGDGRSDLASVTVGSVPVFVMLNTTTFPPVANPQSVTVGQGLSKAVTLTGSAPNGDPFTFQVASGPSHGTLSGTAPNLTYTPAAGYSGTDTFAFTVTDTTAGLTSARATITLAVVPPPTANTRSLNVLLNTALNITLTGSAPNGDPYTFAIGVGPAHGTLSGLNAATGAVTYTPGAGYTGPDSFQFTVTDTVSNLTSAAATVSLTVTAPAVVGQFGNQGVWKLNGVTGAWTQLTAANATLLADDLAGDVAAEFPGYGVWEYTTSTGWKQLHPVDVTLLAMDQRGDVVADFPGYGVGQYTPASGWHLLTAANASLLAEDANGDIAASFPGYGVWEFTTASNAWKQLHPVDVTLLAMDAAGDVAANFPGYGVGRYTAAAGWRLLDGVQASALAMDASGDVAANFPGYGVGEFPAGGGAQGLTGANAALLGADTFGAFYAEFVGYGVWRYDPPRGWVQLTPADATLLAVA